MEGLTEGRIVHYVLEDGPNKGEHRPAIIVKVWSQENGCSNLQVFIDGSNDSVPYSGSVVWKTSRIFDPDHKPSTWHWIEKA